MSRRRVRGRSWRDSGMGAVTASDRRRKVRPSHGAGSGGRTTPPKARQPGPAGEARRKAAEAWGAAAGGLVGTVFEGGSFAEHMNALVLPADMGLPASVGFEEWVGWHYQHGRLGPFCPYPRQNGWDESLALFPGNAP